MKKLLLVLLCFGCFFSCEKKEIVYEQEVGKKSTLTTEDGTYELTSYLSGYENDRKVWIRTVKKKGVTILRIVEKEGSHECGIQIYDNGQRDVWAFKKSNEDYFGLYEIGEVDLTLNEKGISMDAPEYGSFMLTKDGFELINKEQLEDWYNK